ncbi:MAG: tetraacyldisaccharide 4'-kinase [Phycisphaerae bacterium]
MYREPGTLSAYHRLLVPLSWLYGLGIRLRNARYDRSPHASRHVALPVISIGNITAGGTGKTPIVMETARRLQELGRRPAILTRGYGAAGRERSDEVMEFSEVLPNVPVVVNPDRVAAAETAGSELEVDCVVLDDGFQHRRLERDLDVVVIDALAPWGGGWVLPAGRLREPLEGLARADLFVISRSNQVASPAVRQIEAHLSERAPHAAVLSATVEPETVVYLDGRSENVEALAYHCVLPVCGIGNPATFLRIVEQLAGRVCAPLTFRDHQRYNRRHVRKVAATARRRGADLVVTTRKDWVKLAALWPDHAVKAAPELARLDVRLELHDDEGVFDDELRRALEKRG